MSNQDEIMKEDIFIPPKVVEAKGKLIRESMRSMVYTSGGAPSLTAKAEDNVIDVSVTARSGIGKSALTAALHKLMTRNMRIPVAFGDDMSRSLCESISGFESEEVTRSMAGRGISVRLTVKKPDEAYRRPLTEKEMAEMDEMGVTSVTIRKDYAMAREKERSGVADYATAADIPLELQLKMEKERTRFLMRSLRKIGQENTGNSTALQEACLALKHILGNGYVGFMQENNGGKSES